MTRNKQINFLCDDRERNQIYELSVLLKRSQEDTIRWIIQQAHLQAIQSSKSSSQKSENHIPFQFSLDLTTEEDSNGVVD